MSFTSTIKVAENDRTFTVGDLVQYGTPGTKDHIVVLVIKKSGSLNGEDGRLDLFTGVVLYAEDIDRVGTTSSTFARDAFRSFIGTIELKQRK